MRYLLKFEHDIWLKNSNFFINNSCFLISVSGGKDSMSLLICINKISKWLYAKKNINIDIYVVHYNHQKRIIDSDLDEQFVLDWCINNGIKFYSYKLINFFDINNNTDNFQNLARNWRIKISKKLLNTLCTYKKYNKGYILTAHHARDNVESILLHALRGSGLYGLKGILKQENVFFRPFIDTKYNDILNYIKNNNIIYREDISNFTNIYFRNKIRNKLLPYLEQISPNYEEAFTKISNNISDAIDKLDRSSYLHMEQLLLSEKTSAMDVLIFARKSAPEVVSSLTAECLRNILIHIRRINKKSRTDEMSLTLSDGWYLKYTYSYLYFIKRVVI